jgi:hypothetical protein
MDDVSYNGYVIRPAPMPLTDGRWNHEVYAVLDKGHSVVERKFFSATTFAAREEAVAHRIEFGRRIIDGEVPNCTVEDL